MVWFLVSSAWKKIGVGAEMAVSCGFDHKTSDSYVFANKKVAEHTVLVVQLMKKYGKL